VNAISLIPEALKEQGPLLIIPVLLLVLGIAAIGSRYGAAEGWTLLLLVAGVVGTLGWAHREKRIRERREAVGARLTMTGVDEMTGKQFEHFCADLEWALGHRDVRVIGGSGDGGIDILSTAPGGTPTAIQCKRRNGVIGPDKVRDFRGALAQAQHHGRAGILMTNARASAEAHRYAEEQHIRVVDRPRLERQIAEANRIGQRTPSPTGGQVSVLGLFRRSRRETKAALSAASIAVLIMAFIAIQIAAAGRPVRAHPAAQGSSPMAQTDSRARHPAAMHSAAPTGTAPVIVVREFFAAISRHDWADVWRIGGRNIGRGPYASYDGMISGYRGTVRDVPTALKTSGQTVSGLFLAYESDGGVRTYEFSYLVRDGAIVAARQDLVETT
jgi:restriction system protein